MLSCLSHCDCKPCRFLLCQPELQHVCLGFLDDRMEEGGLHFVLFPTSWQAVCLSAMMSWGMSLFRNRSSFCLLGCPPLCTLQEFYPLLCNKAEKWAPCWETVGGPLSPKRTLWEAVWDVMGLLLHNRGWNITFFMGAGKHLFQAGKLGLLTAVWVFSPLHLMFYLVWGVNHHCWMSSWFLLMKVVRTWKFIS